MYDFAYHRPKSLTEAVAALKGKPEARPMSGGMTLIPTLKQRLAKPTDVIDLGGIKELAGIKVEGNAVTIGAMTRHAEVATSADVKSNIPALAGLAGHIGDPQVRNRGTLGGSLAHADPSADYPAAMIAAGAEVLVRSAKGSRAIKAENCFIDLFTVDVAPDEIITSVLISPSPASAYAKLHQRASHFAIVGVGASLEVSGGAITAARVGLTGASSHAQRLAGVEAALAGKPATKATIEAASKGVGAGLDVVNADLHASEEYRRAMVDVFVKRALLEALARA
jgi:aerobic carbon-monoxide dehydrogenase medium subunit